MRGPDAQRWSETTRSGRLILSGLIAALLICVVVENLPTSSLREAAEPVAANVLMAIGVEQQWSMFAPDPRSVSIALEARVRSADGSATTWRPPAGGPFVGGYWDHRWAKLVEHVTFDKSVEGEAMRSGLARFGAREVAAAGQQPMEVRLVSIQSAAGERSELQIYQLAFSEGGP